MALTVPLWFRETPKERFREVAPKRNPKWKPGFLKPEHSIPQLPAGGFLKTARDCWNICRVVPCLTRHGKVDKETGAFCGGGWPDGLGELVWVLGVCKAQPPIWRSFFREERIPQAAARPILGSKQSAVAQDAGKLLQDLSQLSLACQTLALIPGLPSDLRKV